MSNVIKSGFVAFSQDDTLVIDANNNRIIKRMEEISGEFAVGQEPSMEEALAEALIQDAELDGADFGTDLLTMDTSQLPDLSGSGNDLGHMTDEVIRSAKDEAQRIIDQAHDEAEQLRAAAYDEAEQIRAQAQQEGYEAGFSQGSAEANQELQKKTRELDQQIIENNRYLQEQECALIQNTEEKMVDLLCQLIPSITGVVIEGQKSVLLYMINMAMQDLENSKQFVIKVSSSDYEDIASRKDEIYGALNPNIDLEIFEDAKLSAMQCLIETDHGIVDVSLDVQLDNLINALRLMIKE